MRGFDSDESFFFQMESTNQSGRDSQTRCNMSHVHIFGNYSCRDCFGMSLKIVTAEIAPEDL